MNHNEINIRKATLIDLKEIQELFVASIQNTCKSDYSFEQIEAWTSSVNNNERWEKAINDQYFIVAIVNSKIVGFASLDKGTYIDFLYVHHNFQGEGIATLLFDDLKNESIRLGFRQLQSDVSKTAKPFFEQKGFKVLKENRNSRNEVVLINYYMSKENSLK